jgi:hypothetical protein
LKENFDRFNFEIYKEKEMADFRRWITVLAVMALFVGLASAQVGTSTGSALGTPFQCNVQTTATPNLRAEGYTEQTGDIVLSCSGGTPLPNGALIPTTNITVYYVGVTAVTSRLLSNVSGINASEALLLIDEPDYGGPQAQQGYGPGLPQIFCNSPAYGAGANGCQQQVGTYNGTPGVPVSVSAPTTAGANVFQGIVTGSAVTFEGIPVLPPVTGGLTRVYRITNVRVNANGGAGGVSGGVAQVSASISTNGATSLQITNPNPIVGYISTSLKTTVANAQSYSQCNSMSGLGALLQFSELFGTAFKVRVDGAQGGATNNMVSSPLTQNVPGKTYNSESNFVFNGQGQGSNGTIPSSGTYTAGLADFGTRLKAVFTNVPAGATVYASINNVNNSSGANGITAFSQPSSAVSTATSYAVLLSSGSEGTMDGNGTVPTATYTNSFTGTSSSGNTPGPVYYVGVTSQGSPIVFVWEIVNTQPTFQETIEFASWIGGAAGVAPNTGTSTSQVNLSYAPNPTLGPFSVTSAGTASLTSQIIPRFADTSGAGSTWVTINLCSTTLLFPYITTLTGFTTAISIANTSTDPFKTTGQGGTCVLYWYQGGTAGNPAASTTAVIPTGTILPLDTSGTSYAGSNFSGYMIASCNFQLAHGVAIVTDLGSQHILATYLALVVPTGTGARNSYSATNPEALNN